MRVNWFDTLDSTNKYCELLDLDKVEEFAVYCTRSQTAGVGQRGNHWASAPGENLTFSMVLKPVFLAADEQFRLTKAASLAVVDFLTTLCLTEQPIYIKWPNDIYVSGSKICGMLLSSHLAGGSISSCIVGVGLNVNQLTFPEWVPNPTSLAILSGCRWELEPLLHQLLDCIFKRYQQLRSGDIDTINNQYLAKLMRLGTMADYLYHDRIVHAAIEGVDRFGHLLLITDGGERLSCQIKEVSFL